MTKVGSGTLTLTASNAFTGATTINGGTLALNTGLNFNGLSGSTTSTIDINNGAVLQTQILGGSNNFNHPIVLGSGGGTWQGSTDMFIAAPITGGAPMTFASAFVAGASPSTTGVFSDFVISTGSNGSNISAITVSDAPTRLLLNFTKARPS